ncbi:MAG: hypothetical protein B9S26_11400 [Opitutia bacterium Tous-C4FEB]|nr:MAG: hypothetical protein B9S26_11400 [Opitutae bacterium Tous-C4FEB]
MGVSGQNSASRSFLHGTKRSLDLEIIAPDVFASISARLRFSGFPREHAQMWRIFLFQPPA